MIDQLNAVCKIIICLLLFLVITSCSKKDENAESVLSREQQEELAREKVRAERKAAALKLAEEKKEEEKAMRLAMEAEELKAELLRKEQEKEQALAEERERLRLEEIAQRQRIQKLACDAFIDTAYEELVLLDGKVLKSAKVMGANAVNVSFMHESGVACVKYSNLPKEIAIACKYDEELEVIAIKQENADKQARLDARAKKLAISNNRVSSSQTNGSRTSLNSDYKGKRVTEAMPKKVVRPKGSLQVRVVGSSKGRKSISVIAKSNVDATLYLNDWYYHRYRVHQVSADTPYSHIWKSVSSKYEVKLVDNKTRKVLGKESSLRKSGLGTSGGL